MVFDLNKDPFVTITGKGNGGKERLEKMIEISLSENVVFLFVRTRLPVFSERIRYRRIYLCKGQGFKIYGVMNKSDIPLGVGLLRKSASWELPNFHVILIKMDKLQRFIDKCKSETWRELWQIEETAEALFSGLGIPNDDDLLLYGNEEFRVLFTDIGNSVTQKKH
jgi:hypothetical protein